jgi:hypothetical protein
MDNKGIIGKLTDAEVVALTLFGESRSEGPEGRIAVANVILNRVVAQKRAWGLTAREVCLAPLQFSCWDIRGGVLNHGVLLDTALVLARKELVGPLLKECLWIAQGLLDRSFVDSTHGATNYLTNDLYDGSNRPAWARDRPILARIGRHTFLRVL